MTTPMACCAWLARCSSSGTPSDCTARAASGCGGRWRGANGRTPSVLLRALMTASALARTRAISPRRRAPCRRGAAPGTQPRQRRPAGHGAAQQRTPRLPPGALRRRGGAVGGGARLRARIRRRRARRTPRHRHRVQQPRPHRLRPGPPRSRGASFREAIALLRAADYGWALDHALAGLGGVYYLRGDVGRAAPLFAEALELAWAVPDPRKVAIALLGIVGVAAARGRADAGARLLGAAEAITRQRRGAIRTQRSTGLRPGRSPPSSRRLARRGSVNFARLAVP